MVNSLRVRRCAEKVGFQVPDNAQGFQFVFDASIFGSGKVFVDLGAEPISVEPPASVTGEGSQLTFNIGELIEMGTTLLTVNKVFKKPLQILLAIGLISLMSVF